MLRKVYQIWYTHGYMHVVQITPERWIEYKELRLKALKDNPLAFDSSPEDEEQLSEEEWKEKLAEENDFKVFIEDNRRLIAKMEVEWDKRAKVRHIAEVYGVYIDPQYRGKGLGKMLMDAVEKLAPQHDIKKLWLDVVVTQAPAMGLYRKLGFREIGRTEMSIQVDGAYHDKLLMEKIL